MAKRANHEQVYEAAFQWVDAALRRDDSLFTPGVAIWSASVVEDLYDRFVLQPDLSKETFEHKLQQQLEGASPETYQLVAELLYFHFLIADKIAIGGDTKRSHIQRVLEWSPSRVEVPTQLAQTLNFGIVNPGTAFHTLRYFQLVFLITFARYWKSLAPDEHQRLLGDPWSFKEEVWKLPVSGAQTQRAALLHLIFPDVYEGITSQEWKSQITSAFSSIGDPDEQDVDRKLLQIRKHLTPIYGSDFTFYDDVIMTQWKGGGPTPWDEFVHWARKFHEWDQFDKQERDYKLEIAKNVQAARDAVESDSDDWLRLLRRAYSTPNNLTNFFAHGKFTDWCANNSHFAKDALDDLWFDPDAPDDRFGRFLDQIPQEALRGTGGRVNTLSLLLMGISEVEYPVYKVTPFHKGFSLTGFGKPDQLDDEAAVYIHAIGFLDRILEEAHNRDLELRDRLDAQSVLWSITSWQPSDPPISEWTDAEQSEFLRWRGDIDHNGDDGDEAINGKDPLQDLAGRLLLDYSYLKDIDDLLQSKKQMIFYGPPGTGKTYVARELARHYAGNDGAVELVQFHPSYAYEDFIEGFRPHQTSSGQPGFRLADGPLKRIAQEAMEDPDAKFVLVIDEINRGNVAKVLGELYFLLEYRDEEISLQYSSETFSLPPNLWIIGTMNTADRSIALIDAALRRRFYFVPFMPDEAPVQGLLRRWLERHNSDFAWVADVVDRANNILGDRHMAIGPSYFMKPDLDERWVTLIWAHSILPYIAEQYFGEESQLEQFQLARLRGLPSTGTQDLDAPADTE